MLSIFKCSSYQLFFQTSLFLRAFLFRVLSPHSLIWAICIVWNQWNLWISWNIRRVDENLVLILFVMDYCFLFLRFILPHFPFISLLELIALMGLPKKREHVRLIFCLFADSFLSPLANSLIGLESLWIFEGSTADEKSDVLFYSWPLVLNLVLFLWGASQVSSFSPSVLKCHSDVQWCRCFSFIVLGIQISPFQSRHLCSSIP